jgi:magnesium-transporting ATPase (P-type)
MIYTLIAIIVIILQVIGIMLARKKERPILENINFLMNFNLRIGIASFYIIAIIWMASTIASLVAPSHIVLYYLIFTSILLAGIGVPLRYYRINRRKSKAQDADLDKQDRT